MKTAKSERTLDTTTLTGSGRIQLTKLAIKALEKYHGDIENGCLFQWYDAGNGDLILRLESKPEPERD